MDLEAYRLQLVAYALALGKPKAYVVDLREGKVHPVPVSPTKLRGELEELLRSVMDMSAA